MSSRMQDPEDAREDTPLLSPDGPEPRSGEHVERGEETAVHGSLDAAQRSRARLSRLRRYLRIVLWTELAASILAAMLTGVILSMLSYGRQRFQVWDYQITAAAESMLLICFVAMVGSGGNLLRMKNSNLPFPSLVNVLLFGMTGVYFLYHFSDLINYVVVEHSPDSSYFCSRGAWDEPSYGGRPRGTWEECLAWESAFIGVLITWIAFIGISGTACLALTVIAFVEAFLQRPGAGGSREAQQSSTWTFPVGQISVEFFVRWGPPGPVTEQSRDENNATLAAHDREAGPSA